MELEVILCAQKKFLYRYCCRRRSTRRSRNLRLAAAAPGLPIFGKSYGDISDTWRQKIILMPQRWTGKFRFCCFSVAPPEGEGAHPPGAYFSRAGKVGKRALRGFTPKNPGFGRSGRGESCFTHRVESRQELPTLALSVVCLPACENWEAETREQLPLFFSCCPWCGGNLVSLSTAPGAL